eukprot:6121937-Pleurochrysis_carterae.AAC.7
MRRWKRAFDMGILCRRRRASCPWRMTKCCCSPSTARRWLGGAHAESTCEHCSPTQVWVQHPAYVLGASWRAPAAGPCTVGVLPAKWRQGQWDFRAIQQHLGAQ